MPRNHYTLVQAVSPVPTSSGLLNSDCSVMPISIYTTDHKAETIERIVEAVKFFRTDNPAASERITFQLASGNVGVMAATNEEVEASQFPILLYVYAAVILLCLISFRSIAATVCIIVPLAVVSLLAYTLMVLLEIGLKISTLPVVALGVGIGVDYGIYIYGRLRTYLAEGMDFCSCLRAHPDHNRHRSGAHRFYPGSRCCHLDWGAAQISGGYGHGTDLRIPGQYDRRRHSATGARRLADQAKEKERTRINLYTQRFEFHF